MPVKLNSLFKNGSPVVMSVRSIIALLITGTLIYGLVSGGIEWQDFKEIALIVFTYFFTVTIGEDKQRKKDGETKE